MRFLLQVLLNVLISSTGVYGAGAVEDFALVNILPATSRTCPKRSDTPQSRLLYVMYPAPSDPQRLDILPYKSLRPTVQKGIACSEKYNSEMNSKYYKLHNISVPFYKVETNHGPILFEVSGAKGRDFFLSKRSINYATFFGYDVFGNNSYFCPLVLRTGNDTTSYTLINYSPYDEKVFDVMDLCDVPILQAFGSERKKNLSFLYQPTGKTAKEMLKPFEDDRALINFEGAFSKSVLMLIRNGGEDVYVSFSENHDGRPGFSEKEKINLNKIFMDFVKQPPRRGSAKCSVLLRKHG